MVTNTLVNGTVIDAGPLNENFGEAYKITGLNLIRSLIDRAGVWSKGMIDWWGDAYVDADGREGSVDSAETGAEFDTNKYKTLDTSGLTEYIIIEATSMGTWTNGDNDTYVNKIGDEKWIVWCDTGTDAVQRAQIHKSLWFGTSGSDQLIDDFTTVTSVQTSNANDVGKRAHYAYIRLANTDANYLTEYTGTFADTSTNNNCSSWSKIITVGASPSTYGRWEMPDGTTLNSQGPEDPGTSDEFGTDTSADELNNPATCNLFLSHVNGVSSWIYSLILCEGDISWVSTGVTPYTVGNTDFYTDESIPDMIAAGSLASEIDYITITHDIPSGTFSTTMSSAVGVPMLGDWETGANIQSKLTGTGGAEDTGWLDAMDTSPEVSTFTAFTDEPDTLIVKLEPKDTSPTPGYPSIKGFVVRGD